jgi:hypothetical protein
LAVGNPVGALLHLLLAEGDPAVLDRRVTRGAILRNTLMCQGASLMVTLVSAAKIDPECAGCLRVYRY